VENSLNLGWLEHWFFEISAGFPKLDWTQVAIMILIVLGKVLKE
jgi:hypothetical protein